jgi:hypothetical protein
VRGESGEGHWSDFAAHKDTRMDQVIWPILNFRSATPEEFVSFWERLYSGYDEDFYAQNIGQPLTGERIEKWFKWKNGRSLSAKKSKSIQRYRNPEEQFEPDADPTTLRAFLSRPGGAIWRIFWLHLRHPKIFPIYDQHVHRAMAFLLKWPNREIPNRDPSKVKTYIEAYRPFTERFKGCDQRKVDRALWTFGRFLSLDYESAITATPTR